MNKLDKDSAMVILSGGQDSTTCLYWAKKNYARVHAVTFDYGQRHKIELQAAAKVAEMAGVDSHEIVHLPEGILASTSPLVSDAKLEQYESADVLPGGIEKTFIPLRNQLFITIAANRAYAKGCLNLVTGVSQADYGGYPDCERPFIELIEAASSRGTFGAYRERFEIKTPLINLSKAATVHLAASLPGCMEAMAYSHTAYDGVYPPTGKDHASLLRAQGFEQAGHPDPLVVRAWREGLMDLPETANYDSLREEEA